VVGNARRTRSGAGGRDGDDGRQQPCPRPLGSDHVRLQRRRRLAKSGGSCGIDDLPVSKELRDRIMEWQDWYERSPLYMTDEWDDLDIFSAEGEAIARAVKAELPDWTIVYHHEAKSIATQGQRWRRWFRVWARARRRGQAKKALTHMVTRHWRRASRTGYVYEITG
jgi:hypothetical protein